MAQVPEPTPPDYRLITRWSLPAPADRVWQVLADPELDWSRWWPGLTSDGTPRPVRDGGAATVGSRAAYALRPARWAYALHFTLEITRSDPPHRAAMTVTGDLDGTGLVRIEPAPEGSTLELDWRVRTTRPWMVRSGRLLAPLFRRAHAHAMDRGAGGLREHLG